MMYSARLAAGCIGAAVAVTMSVEAAATNLVLGGKSNYTIVLPKEASPSEEHAATELQKFLLEVSGAELPVVVEGGGHHRRMIVLGNGETLRSLGVGIDFDELGDEGFVIRTVSPHLVIAGGRLRGTMYGVYAFLEEVLGCRWYTPHVSRIPKKRTIRLDELNITQKPDFEYREVLFPVALDGDWAARNRLNSNFARLDEARGGKVSYHHFVHTFDSLVPPSVYMEEHPEYYSLVDGKRTKERTQLCMSNPDVQSIAAETVLRWIEERPDAKIFSVSQNDWYENCQCDKCRAIDEEEGSPSGLLLRFVNGIAEEVEKKHPGKLIDTLAYQWTEKPPKITKPRHNVRVRLCPIFQCQYHPYEQCEKNKAFVEDLRGWSKITENLYIWHYVTNFPNYLLPMPNLDELKADIPMYERFGVKGMFMQGSHTAGGGPHGGGGFMDNLKAYVLAKMLWNTEADADALRADFMHGFFGRSGDPLNRFLDVLHRKVHDENIHGTIWDTVDAEFLSEDVMTEGDRLFNEAERVADDADVLARVKHARLSLEYVKIMREVPKVAESGTPEERADVLRRLEDFKNRCVEGGIRQWREGLPIDKHFEQLAETLRN